MVKFYNTALLKGKKENDSLLIAKSYSVLGYLYEDDLETALAYTDSLNRLPLIEINAERYIYAPYQYGYLYAIHEKPKKALDHYLISYNRAEEFGELSDKLLTLKNIAAIYGSYYNSNYSLEIEHKIIKLIQVHKHELGEDMYNLYLLERYNSIIGDHIKLKQYDSAFHFVNISKKLNKHLNYRYEYDYHNTLVREAETNYYLKNYKASKVIFDSILPLKKELHSIINAKFYLGMIAGHEGNYKKKITEFKEIDSLMQLYSGPLYSTHDTYTFLLQDAVEHDQKETQLYYLNKLIQYDSVEESNILYIQNKEKLNFELDELRKIRSKLKEETRSKYFILWIGSILVIVLLLILVLNNLRSKRIQNALQKKLQNPILVYPTNEKSIGLQPSEAEHLEPILKKLNEWELQKKYTNKQITLPSLATELNTNPLYLSKVINKCKGQNFANYLKDLRITFLINYLKENPSFADGKSVVQIAEHFGFNSKDVLTRTLKKKIGVTPALFIKTIKSNK